MPTPQQKYILETVPSHKKFFPAMFVKRDRKFPIDYRKRLSEMKLKGWFRPLDEYQENMRAWIMTAKGRKLTQK